MSKFNTYARQVNDVKRRLFDVYEAALSELKEAEKQYEESKLENTRTHSPYYPVNDEIRAATARIESRYYEKKGFFEKARRELVNGQRQIEEIRSQLLADIDKSYMARPDQLDANAMELIRSGILKPNELSAMLKDFEGNPTMTRMIGAHAKQRAAEADAARDGNTRAGYLQIVSEAAVNDGSEYVAAFDYVADVFRRCVRTPDLAKEWDNLTAQVIEEF